MNIRQNKYISFVKHQQDMLRKQIMNHDKRVEDSMRKPLSNYMDKRMKASPLPSSRKKESINIINKKLHEDMFLTKLLPKLNQVVKVDQNRIQQKI